jgi:hypothetical protein
MGLSKDKFFDLDFIIENIAQSGEAVITLHKRPSIF